MREDGLLGFSLQTDACQFWCDRSLAAECAHQVADLFVYGGVGIDGLGDVFLEDFAVALP